MVESSQASTLERLLSPVIPSMTLDFSECPALFQLLKDLGIDERQVVELLSLLVDGKLRQVRTV